MLPTVFQGPQLNYVIAGRLLTLGPAGPAGPAVPLSPLGPCKVKRLLPTSQLKRNNWYPNGKVHVENNADP